MFNSYSFLGGENEKERTPSLLREGGLSSEKGTIPSFSFL